jgi:hypothetical protein
MTRGLIFSSAYNLFLVCWLKESGVLGEHCDVLLSSADDALAARLRDSGYFENVMTLADSNDRGINIIQRYEAMNRILHGSGRVIRGRSRYMELLSPGRFYGAEIKDWDKYFSHTTIFEGLVPHIDYIRWKNGVVSCWEHGIISVKGSRIRCYSFPHWADSHSLWLGVHGIGHPRDSLSELCASRPELADPKLRRQVALTGIPGITRDNTRFGQAMETLFEIKKDVSLPPGMIYFPHVIKAEEDFLRMERNFLEEAVEVLGGENITAKTHPYWKSSTLPAGVNPSPLSHIPWEMLVFESGGCGKRLLAAPYCTTALISPKAYFDEEPYILNLALLFSKSARDELSKLELELARDVKLLYRNPEKYCIPESWDESREFLRRYRDETLPGDKGRG